MLYTVIRADKNGLVSGRLACTSSKNLKQKSILDCNSRILEYIEKREKYIIQDLNHDLTFYCSHNPMYRISLITIRVH